MAKPDDERSRGHVKYPPFPRAAMLEAQAIRLSPELYKYMEEGKFWGCTIYRRQLVEND